MKCIGITGSVGTGKSQVADLLNKYFNAYIIKADHVGHAIMRKGSQSYNLILNYFGREILDLKDEIDRKKLGEIVFNNRLKLEQLNKFTHPFIYKKIKDEIESVKRLSSKYNYIAIEVPLLIESGFDLLVNEIWYVYAEANVRKERLKKSRGYSDEKLQAILENQLEDHQYRQAADYIIDNSYSLENTLVQIKNILMK